MATESEVEEAGSIDRGPLELRRGQWSCSTGSEEAGSIDRGPLELRHGQWSCSTGSEEAGWIDREPLELRRGQWSRSTGSEEAGWIDREPLEPDGSGVVEVFVAGSDDALAGEGAPPGGQLSRPLARGCVVAASLTLIIAMIAVAVTGFTSSTWTYSRHTMDREASARLANLADAMAAAGAPRAAVVHVRAAAQPGINRGAALEALGTAVQILAETGDDPHLVPLRRQLHRVFLEIYEKEYGTPPTPEQRPTVPSFEA